jgi:hypothetical protein
MLGAETPGMEAHDLWQFGKDNDASNWFVIMFSLVVWPSALSVIVYYWSKRKIQEIPHFEISPISGQKTNIGGHTYDAVGFIFTNRTGSIVYVREVSLRENATNFPIPPAAVRSISGGREIKFQNQHGQLVDDERILNTNDRALTSIAVSRPMGSEFDTHQPGLLRRIFRRPKYFILEYTAMVGEKKYSIATVY